MEHTCSFNINTMAKSVLLNGVSSSIVISSNASLVPRPCVDAEAQMSFSSTGSGSVPPIVGGTGAVNQDVIMFGE